VAQNVLNYRLIVAVSQKTRHHTHADNFAKNLSMFKILWPVDSKQKFLQNTLQMFLHYFVILQCFKNRINSKIHYRRMLFWSIFADVHA